MNPIDVTSKTIVKLLMSIILWLLCKNLLFKKDINSYVIFCK
jgi:hypothetical protein